MARCIYMYNVNAHKIDAYCDKTNFNHDVPLHHQVDIQVS